MTPKGDTNEAPKMDKSTEDADPIRLKHF